MNEKVEILIGTRRLTVEIEELTPIEINALAQKVTERIAELQDLLLFDVYEGKNIPEGKKSLAIRLTFGRSDRTLTDVEVAGFVAQIVAALAEKLGAALRG